MPDYPSNISRAQFALIQPDLETSASIQDRVVMIFMTYSMPVSYTHLTLPTKA
ncbi:Transposase, IS1480 family protein (plasmid) [Lactobacillus rhamnosus Lc 705] [Lacticaseibacillus rhamnosus]|nr:Transposase, IS1480 family protein (plasmid) [Lactobacillus rhamnosus Lc 705] [Lacticaseibacillus rhamnosus]